MRKLRDEEVGEMNDLLSGFMVHKVPGLRVGPASVRLQDQGLFWDPHAPALQSSLLVDPIPCFPSFLARET